MRLLLSLAFLFCGCLPTEPVADPLEECLNTPVDSATAQTPGGDITVTWSAVCVDTVYLYFRLP